MSLDIMELIMEVEEAFDVVLPDRDLERVTTVGGFYRLVLKKLGCRQNGPCLSGAVFYSVRRALLDVTDFSRREIGPRSRLDELLPVASRRWQWQHLRDSVRPLRVPRLRRPTRVIATIAVGVLCFFGVAAWMAHGVVGVAAWGALIVAAVWARLVFETAVVTRAALRLSAPLAVHFPPEFVTVGDIARDIVRRQRDLIADAVCPPGADPVADEDGAIWEMLCQSICESAGVRRDQLTQATAFADLGLD